MNYVEKVIKSIKNNPIELAENYSITYDMVERYVKLLEDPNKNINLDKKLFTCILLIVSQETLDVIANMLLFYSKLKKINIDSMYEIYDNMNHNAKITFNSMTIPTLLDQVVTALEERGDV